MWVNLGAIPENDRKGIAGAAVNQFDKGTDSMRDEIRKGNREGKPLSVTDIMKRIEDNACSCQAAFRPAPDGVDDLEKLKRDGFEARAFIIYTWTPEKPNDVKIRRLYCGKDGKAQFFDDTVTPGGVESNPLGPPKK